MAQKDIHTTCIENKLYNKQIFNKLLCLPSIPTHTHTYLHTLEQESLMGNSMGSLRSSTATQAGPKGASGDKGEPGRPGDRGEKVSQRPKTTLV